MAARPPNKPRKREPERNALVPAEPPPNRAVVTAQTINSVARTLASTVVGLACVAETLVPELLPFVIPIAVASPIAAGWLGWQALGIAGRQRGGKQDDE